MPVCELSDYKIYLREMRICLDLNFNLTDCENKEVQKKIYGCSKRVIFQYPEYPKLSAAAN